MTIKKGSICALLQESPSGRHRRLKGGEKETQMCVHMSRVSSVHQAFETTRFDIPRVTVTPVTTILGSTKCTHPHGNPLASVYLCVDATSHCGYYIYVTGAEKGSQPRGEDSEHPPKHGAGRSPKSILSYPLASIGVHWRPFAVQSNRSG